MKLISPLAVSLVNALYKHKKNLTISETWITLRIDGLEKVDVWVADGFLYYRADIDGKRFSFNLLDKLYMKYKFNKLLNIERFDIKSEAIQYLEQLHEKE